MNNTEQKFRVIIDIRLDEENLDVQVQNLSARKGYIDMPALRRKLLDVFSFMQTEGMESLVEQVNAEQLH